MIIPDYSVAPIWLHIFKSRGFFWLWLERDVTIQDGWDARRYNVAGFEDGGKDSQGQECGQTLEAGTGEEKILPESFLEGTKGCWHLDFSPVGPMSHFCLREP